MLIKKRRNELLAEMKSFSKEKYLRTELLDELFSLQKEIVELVFKSENVNTDELKIWDVERRFEQLNRDCGNVADKELEKFKLGSKELCNTIKAHVSGIRGEAKAFSVLEHIRSKSIVLRNIELSDGEERTEIDALVITPKALTIVEVKNTSRNIFIDEKGDYYRTGEFLKLDCNISDKMSLKEKLVKRILQSSGIEDIEIKSIIVFTDNRMEVHNKYPEIKVCFVSQLAHIIDGYRDESIYTDEQMGNIEMLFKEVEYKEAYPLEFDVEQYKMDFATVMTILENAQIKANEPERIIVMKKNKLLKPIVSFVTSKEVRRFGKSLAVSALSIASAVAINVLKKGGDLQ